MYRELIFMTLVATAAVCDGYHILCISPIPSRSHNTLGKGIVDALLNDGHQVTWVSPYPDKKVVKNLKVIDLSHVSKPISDINMMDDEHRHSGMKMVKEMGRNITLALMETPAVQELLLKGKFDAVVTEWFFTDAQAGIAAVLQCPWILLNGMVIHPNLEYLVDSVQSPGVLPMMINDYPVPMGFLERLKNTLFIGVMMGTYVFQDLSENEALYIKLFSPIAKARGVQLRPFSEALHDISVVFVNSDPAIAHAQSVPPNVFSIAGYHLDDNTAPLPQDLQTLLDNSPQGFIYFSMGSVLKSAMLPKETRSQLLKIFAKLPYTVLWKFEETIEGLPKNVHVRPWMPQQSILAHPNIKLFITHGGMLSSIEAVHFGVPLLTVPMFGDQPSNAARAERRGFALVVPFSNKLAGELEVALTKMLGDDRYYKKAKSLSKVFRARLVPPKQTVAHYTRLAIESQGAHHLRSKALLYPWYQRLLVDQLVLLLAIIAIIISILRRIVNIFRKPKEEEKKSGGKKKLKNN